MAKTEYTLFQGDILRTREELKKASEDDRKPILMNSQTFYTEDRLKRLVTTYSIIFEKTVAERAGD